METALSLEALATQVDLPLRTVRFYIQKGLVPRPTGSTRAATYGAIHVQRLRRIKALVAEGLSLARIAELLQVPHTHLPAIGQLDVRTHIQLAPGVELVISPEHAGLHAAQLRALVQAVTGALADLTAAPAGTARDPQGVHDDPKP